MSSLVQSAIGTNEFGGNPAVLSFTSDVTAGNLMVVKYNWVVNPSNPAATIIAFGDTLSNVWTQAAYITAGPTTNYEQIACWIAYAVMASSGGNGFGILTDNAPNGNILSIMEFNGVSILNASATNTATGANPSAGSIASNAGDVAVAAIMEDDGFGIPGSYTAGIGWTLLENDGGGNSAWALEYQVNLPGGTLTGDFTKSTGTFVATVASFTQSGPPSPPPNLLRLIARSA